MTWVLLLVIAVAPPKRDASTRWEKAIAALEASDRKKPPPASAVHFCGSSSIVMWPLEKSFPGWKVVKRGFGGSRIADSTRFAGRIITPHRPAAIVFYAGDNDLASGASPEKVRDDFRTFVARVRQDCPETRILFLSIKPSILRWKLWEKMKRANDLVKAECGKGRGLAFIDIAPATLGDDGKPRKELFLKDGLHLSAAGYAAWSKVVAEALEGR
ncbi:MAG: hypothetical protein K2W96_26200 [Gemmataceae bacterium]|nr:hypothetical protein [Gemmataceae bacterium]